MITNTVVRAHVGSGNRRTKGDEYGKHPRKAELDAVTNGEAAEDLIEHVLSTFLIRRGVREFCRSSSPSLPSEDEVSPRQRSYFKKMAALSRRELLPER